VGKHGKQRCFPSGASGAQRRGLPSRSHYDEHLSPFRDSPDSAARQRDRRPPHGERLSALFVEHIGKSADGHCLVSLCHDREQNGNLMRDPELVFELSLSPLASMAMPLSFQNDYMGVLQEVYRYDEDGKKTRVNVRLKQELASFAETWFANLKDQGFLGDTATRKRLSGAFYS